MNIKMQRYEWKLLFHKSLYIACVLNIYYKPRKYEQCTKCILSGYMASSSKRCASLTEPVEAGLEGFVNKWCLNILVRFILPLDRTRLVYIML